MAETLCSGVVIALLSSFSQPVAINELLYAAVHGITTHVLCYLSILLPSAWPPCPFYLVGAHGWRHVMFVSCAAC